MALRDRPAAEDRVPLTLRWGTWAGVTLLLVLWAFNLLA
jgi:hypothetical protein